MQQPHQQSQQHCSNRHQNTGVYAFSSTPPPPRGLWVEILKKSVYPLKNVFNAFYPCLKNFSYLFFPFISLLTAFHCKYKKIYILSVADPYNFEADPTFFYNFFSSVYQENINIKNINSNVH